MGLFAMMAAVRTTAVRLRRAPGKLANRAVKAALDRAMERGGRVTFERAQAMLAACDAAEAHYLPKQTGWAFRLCLTTWTDDAGRQVASGRFSGPYRYVTVKGTHGETVFEGAEADALAALGRSVTHREVES